ncbi:MAG TPA: YjgN family protein [Nitrococcus sp.]|nr:YjgN family protein [Nitrococcus sp.]
MDGEITDHQRIEHHGTGGELFIIFIVNLLLKIVTLGIYHFWAKTRVRRYLWTQTSIDGERFEYTGSGRELLIGFLKAVGLYILAVMGFMALSWAATALVGPKGGPLAMTVFALLIVFAAGAARYASRRYLLTRTRYRGIRLGLEGSAWRYAALAFGYGLLTIATLGLAAPWARMALDRYVYNHQRFGSLEFEFDGRGGDLFKSFALCLLLAVPTLGLSLIWYAATEARYVASRLRLGPVHFGLAVSGGQFLGLVLGNLLLILATLGFAMPWVTVRTLRFFTARTQVVGELAYDAVLQAQEAADATGEGFADAFDLGTA